jgi:hypothetical protein
VESAVNRGQEHISVRPRRYDAAACFRGDEPDLSTVAGHEGPHTGGPTSGRITFTVARVLVLVAIPAWLVIIVARGNPPSEAQTGQGLSAIIAGHVFEHAPDYLFTPCVAIAGLMCFPRRPRPQRSLTA